jgi:hypothetical protein
LRLISGGKNNLLTHRRGPISVILSTLSFACFSFFLFFALIDMVLTVPLPPAFTVSSTLSEVAIALLILASLLFGVYNWRPAIVPSVVAWGLFYVEYLTPGKLRFWGNYLVSATSSANGDPVSIVTTPFWTRPDVDAITLFLIGFSFLAIWQIVSWKKRIAMALPIIFLVPMVMLALFELVVGTINPHVFELSIVMGFRVDFVPSFVWSIKNIWVLDVSVIVITLCLLSLFFQNNRQTKAQ